MLNSISVILVVSNLVWFVQFTIEQNIVCNYRHLLKTERKIRAVNYR